MKGAASTAASMAKFRGALVRPRGQPLRIVRRLGTLRRNIRATNTQFDRAAQDIYG